MRTKVAHLADGPVRYLESGAGKAVILLHAFPLSADQWLPQLHRVPPGWRAAAPDLRGFRGVNASFVAHVHDELTMDDYAADVLSFMTHLEIERAVIAGVSMGGYVAMALLRRAPARVAGVVLANTRAAPDSTEGLAARDRMIALAQREGPSGVAAEMLPKLLGGTSREEQPDLLDVVRRMIEANSTEGLVAAVRAMKRRPDSSSLLGAIDCPVLVVGGEEDSLIPRAEVESLAENIRGARLAIVPRAGHLTNLESPVAFNEALTQFVTSPAR
jgi:pimeloyl-ACP methyl ester carboxylesterase